MNFDLLAKWITPATVLDIGAGTGTWHNEARLRWPNARFTLIEGNFECEEQLRATGAEAHIALLSDAEKFVTFWTRRDSPACTGASIYREATEFYAGDKAVPKIRTTTTLAQLMWQRRFDLIKIDTQGSELDIMRGGESIIRDAQAVVLELSETEYNRGAPLAQEVSEFMSEMGFDWVDDLGDIPHPITREIVQRDALFIRR